MARRPTVKFAVSDAAANSEADAERLLSETAPKVRRPTLISAENNPFIQKETGTPDPHANKKIESLATCRRITHAELLDLIDVLEHIE